MEICDEENLPGTRKLMTIMKPFTYVGGNACKPSVGNHLVYLHMSNHYRRIYNAKCTVDTSPPRAYKSNRSVSRRWRRPHINSQLDLSSCGPTECELELVDIITNDTKQSPHMYTGCTWREEEVASQTRGMSSRNQQHECVDGERGHCRGRTTSRTLSRPPSNRKFRSVPVPDIMDQHAKSFKSPDQAFKPRILKTEAQSRLRDLRVYHPPSRRSQPFDCEELREQQKEQHQQSKKELTLERCSDLCDAQKHESSKESSRDSAYSGGVSSGAESRGPTPDQSSLVTMCPSLPAGTVLLGSPSADNVLAGGPSTDTENPSADSMMTGSPSAVKTLIRRPTAKKDVTDKVQLQKKEEAAYVKFVHDITEDVLARGIYSDRGLRQLFQRHLAENAGRLNLDRMRDEVALLCEQLGIPQTDRSDCGGELVSLLELFQVVESSECQACPVHISEERWGEASHDGQCKFCSEASGAEKVRGRNPSLEETGLIQEVRSGACQTSENIITADGSVDSSTNIFVLDEFVEPILELDAEQTPDRGPRMLAIGCQTSEISVTDQSVGSNTMTSDEQTDEMLSEFVGPSLHAEGQLS